MPVKPCKYCDGKGTYTVYTWGVKEVKLCQFCGSTGLSHEEEK